MTKVKIEDIIDHLDEKMRNALEETIKEQFPKQKVDRYAIFRTFKKMVGRKCETWEDIPDNLIEKQN